MKLFSPHNSSSTMTNSNDNNRSNSTRYESNQLGHSIYTNHVLHMTFTRCTVLSFTLDKYIDWLIDWLIIVHLHLTILGLLYCLTSVRILHKALWWGLRVGNSCIQAHTTSHNNVTWLRTANLGNQFIGKGSLAAQQTWNNLTSMERNDSWISLWDTL